MGRSMTKYEYINAHHMKIDGFLLQIFPQKPIRMCSNVASRRERIKVVSVKLSWMKTGRGNKRGKTLEKRGKTWTKTWTTAYNYDGSLEFGQMLTYRKTSFFSSSQLVNGKCPALRLRYLYDPVCFEARLGSRWSWSFRGEGDMTGSQMHHVCSRTYGLFQNYSQSSTESWSPIL